MMQRSYSPLVPGRTSPFVPECWAERVRKHLEEFGRMANNMKLEEAIAHLDESLNDQSHDWGCEECKQNHEQLREWLIELKERRAAEVKPVMRGKWVWDGDTLDWEKRYFCNRCEWKTYKRSDYCPSCGAIMSEEQKE